MSRILKIRLLGEFSLTYGDEPIRRITAERQQSLLVYLILNKDSPQSRAVIAELFWGEGDLSNNQPRTNLRNIYYKLRAILPDAERFLRAENQTLQWNPNAPFTVDVTILEEFLNRIEHHPLDQELFAKLVDLYPAKLMPYCNDFWIVRLRDQLHSRVVQIYRRYIDVLENQQAYSAAIRCAQQLLRLDHVDDQTYQDLMRLHAYQGNIARALRVYHEYRSILRRDLGVGPSAGATQLYKELQDGVLKPPATTPLGKRSPAIPPLVGRELEWQRLRSAWSHAYRGQAHFVCIWGEAGLGKTRLAEELCDWVQEQGNLVVRTRAYQAQGALPYAPIAELLRLPVVYNRVKSLNEARLAELSRLLPQLFDEHPALPVPQPMSEEWQQRFFEAVTHTLMVDEQPLLLLLDDLQWCDRQTLVWLSYLLRFNAQARLLIVGACRLEAVDFDHPFTTLQLALQCDQLLDEIVLTPLDEAEVTALAQSVNGGSLTPAQTEQLFIDTEGNPLFVLEMVRAGLARNSGEAQGTTMRRAIHDLPATIYAVLNAHLSLLSPSARKLASLAAVIGRSFSTEVLIAAAQIDEESVVENLDELWTRRILRERGMNGYDFSHNCLRDVAYAQISRAQKRLLHRQVAEALERLYAAKLYVVSSQLAFHYEHAGIQLKAQEYYRITSKTLRA